MRLGGVENVKVDAYVMTPFIGLLHPNQAIQRLTGFVGSVGPGSGGAEAKDAHVVTCTLADGHSWVPSADDLSHTENEDGHMCIVANVYADGDGHALLDAEDLHVVDDQHQGQRNIHVAAMQLRSLKALEFFVMPVPRHHEDMFVRLQPVDLRGGLSAGDLAVLLSREEFVMIGEGEGEGEDDGRIAVRVDGELFPLFASDRPLSTELTIGHFGKLPPMDDDEVDRRIVRDGDDDHAPDHPDHPEPWHHRPDRWHHVPTCERPAKARLQLGTDEEQFGAMQAIDVVQHDVRGRALGGLRIITVAVG